MAASSELKWRIHLGAHKTGTSHAQDTLALRRGALAELGVDYPTLDQLRRARFASCVRPVGPGLKDVAWIRRLRQACSLRLIRGAATAHTRLISEEQILGGVSDLLEPELYPEASERLRNLRDLVQGAPTILFLSIRNPADLLPSAYAQCLRTGRRGLPRIEDVLRRALAQPPSWTHLVRRIREAFPEAELVSWRLEDYTHDPGAHLDLLVGQAVGDWPVLEPPASTRSLSATTLDRILALDPRLSQSAHSARCRQLAAEDTGQPRYRPFSEADKAALTAAYAHDLAAMDRDFPGVLRR